MDILPLAVSVALVGPFGMASAPPPVAHPGIATAVSPTRPDRGGRGTPWQAPVDALEVVAEFDAPAQRWLPGHRGVDLRARPGSDVATPADGRVAFTGMVAGRPVVSVDHEDPHRPGAVIRTTYEPVRSTVTRGATVTRGDLIGTLADDSHCAGGCLHWGARRGEDYVDPLTFLRRAVRLWTPSQRTG